MTRRLILAILGTAIVALILTGVGTLGLATIGARANNERAVTRQAADVASGYAQLDSTLVVRPAVAEALRKVMRLDGVAFLRQDKSGQLVGQLPGGLLAAAIDADALRAGTVVHGHRGRMVWAAAPATAPDGRVIVAVLVRKGSVAIPSVWRWFVLSSIAVVLLGAAVAVSLGKRLTKPIRDADVAARKIAAGELTTRLPEPHPTETDELADLVRSVNVMASSLERSKAVEQEFLLSISHDLRTPLTSIRGYAEAIADGATPDSTWAAGVILKEAKRLERLVADLLDLAKLQARTFSLHLRPVDLSSAASDATMAFGSEFAGLGLQLVVDCPQAVVVRADPDRVGQILGNLIENAKRYAISTVTVGTRVAGDIAMVWVDDDGPGIPAADRPHVFERLYRTGLQPTRAENSSGLGLAIVAELAAAMGAAVTAEQAPAGGARLVVRFPDAPKESSLGPSRLPRGGV